MFACPNLNDKKVRDLVDKVGTLYYHYYTNIYGENIPDEVLEPKLRHEPVAKYVIDWLENANDWRLAIKGLDPRVRNTVESLLEGVTSLKEATAIIARQAALEGADGILYYPSSLNKYRQRTLQSQYSPLDLAIRFYDLNYAGFTNTSASEAQIKQFFKKHGYDVEVKTATSGAKYIKYGNRMLKPMYNLNEGPVQLDEVKGAKVREFLKKLGVPIEYVDSIVTQDGLSANAAVTMSEIDGQLRATIQAVFGVSDAVLGEEAAHILVATLRNTPMYGQLMSDITSRPEYAEVLEEYGGLSEYDKTALKEEAVGKVIVKALAGAEVSPKDVSLIERILNYLKRIFTEAASLDNPYSKAADMILNPDKYDTQGEQLQAPVQVMYSLKAGQGWKKANTDGSIGKVADSEGVEHYTLNGKEMQTRATEVAKADSAKRNKNYVPTPAEESRFEEARQNGSLVHEIADRIAHDVYNGISTPEGEISNAVVHNAMRPVLEKIIGEAKDRDPNVQIFTELTVVDPKFAYKDSITGRRKVGIGGTIDLLIVYSDGTADIYDYKTFGRKAISSYKLNEYNKQVKIYKDILEQGLPELDIPPVKVNKSRIIPVNLSIKRGTIIAANVADEVPVAYELTGNNVLDSVLITMYDRLATLNETSPSKLGDTERQKREQEIRMLYQAINKTLLDKNFEHIASEAEQLLERYNAEIGVADFKYLRIIMDKAKGFEMYNDLVTEADPATEQRIIRITGLANSVYKKAERKFIENFREEHKIDLLDDYFQSTTMGRDFRGHRQAFKNPAGKAMSRLLAIQAEKRRDAEKKLNKEIVEARGKLGREAFDKMVNKATGKLIYMFDMSFYKAQEEAVANNDMAWAVDNKVLDTEAFEAAKAKKQESLNKSRDLTDQQKQLYFEEWVERNNNLLTSPYARVKDSEKWYSAEYKALLADPEAHAFYEFFKSKIKELGDMLEIYISPTFIPKISARMVEKLVTDPQHVRSIAARKFFDPQIGEDSEVGNYNPITGKPIYEIPLYFMDNSVTPEQQSYDLDTLLFKFGEMAIEHKLMKEIEDRLHLLQHVIQNADFIGTTAGGSPLINKITKGLQRSKASGSGDIQHFENVMNYYLYGIKDKELNKFVYYLDKAISFNSIRVLGGNPISGIVNYTAGKANQFIQSARGTYFTPEQLAKASNLVITRDKKAYELMNAMNFFQDIPSFRYAMANVAIDRLVDDNLLFAMLEYPEVSVQFSTAMAMMQNYTYYEGNIIRKKDAAKQILGIYTLYNRPAAEVRELKNQIKKQEEALPSLYDQASVIDGKLAINGEVNVETNAFLSGMIQEVNKKIFGNMSPDDIAGYKFQIVKRILMQFRSWMPRTVDERFQELKYNEFLGDWEMGRYRSTIDHFRAFFSKQAEDMRLSVLFNPVEAGKIAYANYVIKFRDKYKKNPEITEDEFIEMHIANLKANIAGSIITVGALLGVLALGAAADDDDELKSNFAFKNSRLIARRVYGELSFYLDPYSLGEIIQRPAAIGSLYLDIVNLGKHLSQEAIGQTFGIEDWVESAKPVKKTLQLIPVVRPAYYLLEDWADQNNIELGVK